MTKPNKTIPKLEYCLAYCKQVNGLDHCKNCGLTQEMIDNDRRKTIENQPPMGISQWRDYGKRYGYWDYFVEDLQRSLIESLPPDAENLSTLTGNQARAVIKNFLAKIDKLIK